MRKRKILIILLIIVIFIVPIVTLASIKTYNKDSDGRTIVYSADDINELEDGTPISLAIPLNAIDDETSDEEIEKQKQLIMEATQAKTSIAGEYSLTDEERTESNEYFMQFEDSELKDKENELKNIFCKYYGEDYTNELFDRIAEEVAEIAGEYHVPESSMTMLKKAIELLTEIGLTEDEREVIEYILNEIDTSFIEDDEVLRSLESLGIELD